MYRYLIDLLPNFIRLLKSPFWSQAPRTSSTNLCKLVSSLRPGQQRLPWSLASKSSIFSGKANYASGLILFALPLTLFGAYTVKEGKLVNVEHVATLSVQEHYSAALEAYQKKKWDELVKQAYIVKTNFPATPFAQEAVFYLGIGYFQQKEYELASDEFTAYLKKQATPKHFEEAIEYKFAIAEKYQKGAKKHLMGWQTLPKWLPAKEEALEIYDEVIMALPHHDLGAKALYGKARLLFKDEDYKASVDTYQMLIRRFPKHALSAQSYLGIAEVYLTQCQNQYPDPDFLDLAEINLRKFRLDFPQDEEIKAAENMLSEMQETYAKNLYETAQFFERTKKPHASIIYYTKVVSKYPNTRSASFAQRRLETLKAQMPENPPADPQ